MMTDFTNTSITIDIKKSRIRIFKTTIQAIGCPKKIQLLVNPKSKSVAIKALEKELSGDQAHTLHPDARDGYEIYSRAFITKLCEVAGGLDKNYSYRMKGNIIPNEKLAVFSMETLVRNE